MLLDLGRNDVGRVAQIGSVQVNTAFGLQKTSHLIHIVSDVTGKLLPECDVIDALVAGFPAGTVSGAPKIRAMEIIDELETERRGIYSGCVGYFPPAATWTPASRCARRWSRTTRSMCRPVAAWSMTAPAI